MLGAAVGGLTARNNVQRMVKLKWQQKGAPVYQYYFTWQSPMLRRVCGGSAALTGAEFAHVV